MNKEKDQDRAFDTYDHFKRFGFCVFPQNLKVYENLIEHALIGHSVLEAGCGSGIGTNLIAHEPHTYIMGTDKLPENIKFAEALFPTQHISFDVWDITKGPFTNATCEIVICVEAIEHVTDVKAALQNLIASAKTDVYFSTPNNYEPEPSNPFHTREWTAREMFEWILSCGIREDQIEILHWNTWEKLTPDTKVNPLVYHIKL